MHLIFLNQVNIELFPLLFTVYNLKTAGHCSNITERYYEMTPETTETGRNWTAERKEAEKSVRLLVEANEIDGCTAVCRSITALEVWRFEGSKITGVIWGCPLSRRNQMQPQWIWEAETESEPAVGSMSSRLITTLSAGRWPPLKVYDERIQSSLIQMMEMQLLWGCVIWARPL